MPATSHQTWIALLRGINVGRAKRVAMADLRALLEGLGYTHVRTLLNSGNAVFTGPRHATPAAVGQAIERALLAQLGVDARVFALTADTLASVMASHPLREVADDDAKLLVAVLAPDTDRTRLAAMTAEPWAPDAFVLGAHAAYLWCSRGVLDSRVNQVFAKAIGDKATARNVTTMTKLLALAQSPATA